MKHSITQSRLLKIVKQRRLTTAQRRSKQSHVYQHLLRNSSRIGSGNFKSLSSEDLGMMFHAIDEDFFEGSISSLCEETCVKPLSFRLSTRMTSSGGMTTMQHPHGRSATAEFEIAVATTPLFETFIHDSSGVVGGLKCDDRLEALQRIMEHEIVHLIEMLLWKDSNCSAKPFREIVHRFFGHLESNHQLLTPRDVARKKLGISVGDRVAFVHNRETLVGLVNRISKRATVLVASSSGIAYTDGKRYEKYYVPLPRLNRVK